MNLKLSKALCQRCQATTLTIMLLRSLPALKRFSPLLCIKEVDSRRSTRIISLFLSFLYAFYALTSGFFVLISSITDNASVKHGGKSKLSFHLFPFLFLFAFVCFFLVFALIYLFVFSVF